MQKINIVARPASRTIDVFCAYLC